MLNYLYTSVFLIIAAYMIVTTGYVFKLKADVAELKSENSTLVFQVETEKQNVSTLKDAITSMNTHISELEADSVNRATEAAKLIDNAKADSKKLREYSRQIMELKRKPEENTCKATENLLRDLL